MTAGALLLAAVIAHRLANPVPYSATGVTMVLAITALIVLLSEHRRPATGVRKTGGLRLGHTVFAVFVTLLVLLVFLYLAGIALMGVQQLAPQSRFLAAVLFELFHIIQLLGALSPLWFAVFYATAAVFVAAGTWVIAPHLPFRAVHRRNAAAFILAGTYGIAVFALVEPALYQPVSLQVAIDIAFLFAGSRVFVIANRAIFQYWQRKHASS